MTGPDANTERYELIDRIAVGGMAEVYRAKAFGAHGFEKTLAIKRILPELAAEVEFENRFISEAKLAVDLSHANIVQVLDFGRFAGSLFIAMEYVDGLDLAALLKRMRDQGRLVPMPAAFQIAIDICRGLDFAHKHDVVHRDVSPSNILLSQAGEVKVADFGIAQAVTTHSSAGGWKRIMGKWRYMSPEQTRGDTLTTRSDVFSLASVMFELFTGEKLFPGDEPEQIARNIDSMQIPSVSSVRKELPARLDDVLAGALERKTSDRTSDAAVIQRQLTEICYECSILATPLDVAELVAELVAEPEPEASSSGGGGIDDLVRAQLFEGMGERELTRKTAVDDDGDRKTALTHSGTAIVTVGSGTDGLSVWELDRETIAAAPQALRAGRRPSSTTAAVREPTATSTTDLGVDRKRGFAIGIIAALAASAGLFAYAFFGDRNETDGDAGAASVARDAGVSDTSDDAIVYLRIDSIPPGAKVFVNGEVLGAVTPTSASVAPGTAHHIKLELSGYDSWEDSDVVVPAGETLRIRPRLHAQVAALSVVSRPKGAAVVLDGRRLGVTPLTLKDLRPGRGRLEVQLEGYASVSESIELVAGQTTTISRTLKSTTVFGKINLHIDDGWAEVYWRGKKIGRAPVRGLKLPVGKHRLLLVNPPTKKKTTITVEVVADEVRYYRTRL